MPIRKTLHPDLVPYSKSPVDFWVRGATGAIEKGILGAKAMVHTARQLITMRCTAYAPCTKEPNCLCCNSGQDGLDKLPYCKDCRFYDSDIHAKRGDDGLLLPEEKLLRAVFGKE